jgi:hypothetical protein
MGWSAAVAEGCAGATLVCDLGLVVIWGMVFVLLVLL